MTRKHFNALADAMHSIRPNVISFSHIVNWTLAMAEWSKAVAAIATVCSDCNPHFNLASFIAACENGTKKV